VVVGVAVSDRIAPHLKERFSEFLTRWRDACAPDKEIKGREIGQEGRRTFCRILADTPGVLITPVTLDLSHLAAYEYNGVLQQMHERFREISSLAIHQTLRDDLDLLSRQIANLSFAQFLRLYSIAYCIRESLQNSIIFISCKEHDDPWQKVTVDIDRVQVRRGAREELIMSNMLLAWLTGWSHSDPFVLVKEIHTASHPFVRRYDTPSGIDLNRILRGNVHWVDSRECWGVQIADIAAAIIYQAVRELDDQHGAAATCAKLMRASRYRSGQSLGLFTPTGREMPMVVQRKYAPLVRIIEGHPAILD
jgi:hypothetical protein